MSEPASIPKDGLVTVAMILDEVQARGLRLYLDAEGRPHLAGSKDMLTSTLLDVLKHRREEIIKHLGGNPASKPAEEQASPLDGLPVLTWQVPGRMQWMKIDGTVIEDDPANPREWAPQGCYWGRVAGGEWLAIPGREPLCQQFPPGREGRHIWGCSADLGGSQCPGCKEASRGVAS